MPLQTWLHLILRQPQYVLSADINILVLHMRKKEPANQDLTWRFWLEDFSSGIWAFVQFFWCCVLPLCSWYQEQTFPEPLDQMVAHLILVDTAACFPAFCSFFPLWVDLLRRGVKKQDQETWSHNLAWVPVKKKKWWLHKLLRQFVPQHYPKDMTLFPATRLEHCAILRQESSLF